MISNHYKKFACEKKLSLKMTVLIMVRMKAVTVRLQFKNNTRSYNEFEKPEKLGQTLALAADPVRPQTMRAMARPQAPLRTAVENMPLKSTRTVRQNPIRRNPKSDLHLPPEPPLSVVTAIGPIQH